MTEDKFRPAAYTVIDKTAAPSTSKPVQSATGQQSNPTTTTFGNSQQPDQSPQRQPVQSTGFVGTNKGMNSSNLNPPTQGQGLGQSNINQSNLGVSAMMRQSVVCPFLHS